MKTFRFLWWLSTKFFARHRSIIAVTTMVSIIIVAIAPRIFEETKKRTHVVRIGFVGRYRVSELPLSITSKLSDGLTGIDDTGRATPQAASSWEMSDEGRTYTVTLDSNRMWHDGTRFMSSDVRLSIQNVDMEPLDDHTLRFRLKEPFAPFPTILSQPLFKKGLIGLGQYRVRRKKLNGEYLEWLDVVSETHPPLRFRFYRTTSDLVTALKLGEVDVLEDLLSLKNVPDWRELVVRPTLHLDRYLAVFFNTRDASLKEKSFRQALTYAIPNKPSGEERALSPIHPLSWAYNPQVKPYLTDLDQARELLSSATEASLPSLTLTTFLPYLDVAEEIAQAWTGLGVTTTVNVDSTPPEDFQALLIGQEIPRDPDQYMLWHSTQPTNISGYSDFRIDKLLEEGRKEMSEEKRKEIYRDFQRFLLEDAPAAFLSHITTYSVKRK